jgi:LysR family nitrogen assimilation transcriptional regulator
MDLKQLEYFVRVAELGSFTRASIELDIAQPALSRQVRLLEVELRQNLLIRNGRGVSTTDAGKLLLEHARGVLHQVERAREELTHARGALTGRVRLGLPPSLTRALTVPLTRSFRARLPEARLSISEGLSASMQESLINGRLDIALLYNAAPSPDIDTIPLLEEDLFLVQARHMASESGPIRLRELAGVPLVIPSRSNAMRVLIEAELAAQGCRPQIALEIDSIPAILDLVADGAGAAVLSRNAVSSLGKPGAFVTRPIVEPSLRSKLSLAVSSRRPTTPTQQAIIELVRHAATELLLPA